MKRSICLIRATEPEQMNRPDPDKLAVPLNHTNRPVPETFAGADESDGMVIVIKAESMVIGSCSFRNIWQ